MYNDVGLVPDFENCRALLTSGLLCKSFNFSNSGYIIFIEKERVQTFAIAHFSIALPAE
jgi:hypothetical protein